MNSSRTWPPQRNAACQGPSSQVSQEHEPCVGGLPVPDQRHRGEPGHTREARRVGGGGKRAKSQPRTGHTPHARTGPDTRAQAHNHTQNSKRGKRPVQLRVSRVFFPYIYSARTCFLKLLDSIFLVLWRTRLTSLTFDRPSQVGMPNVQGSWTPWPLPRGCTHRSAPTAVHPDNRDIKFFNNGVELQEIRPAPRRAIPTHHPVDEPDFDAKLRESLARFRRQRAKRQGCGGYRTPSPERQTLTRPSSLTSAPPSTALRAAPVASAASGSLPMALAMGASPHYPLRPRHAPEVRAAGRPSFQTDTACPRHAWWY